MVIFYIIFLLLFQSLVYRPMTLHIGSWQLSQFFWGAVKYIPHKKMLFDDFSGDGDVLLIDRKLFD